LPLHYKLRVNRSVCSSGFSDRKVPRLLGQGLTKNTVKKASIYVWRVVRLYTRARPSLIQSVGGLHFLTVGAPFVQRESHRVGSAIPGAVSRHEDTAFGMSRTEITCTACGGHLGHVFKGEGFSTPSECFLV
jgi:hypothetical protein